MKINYRQTCILVLMCQIALKFLALPSLMYMKSGSDSIFAVLVLMIIDGLYAYLLLSVAQKSGERNFYQFMCACLGKVLTKILLFILLFKYALVIANISKGLEFFVVDNLYNEFKWYYYALPLVAVVGFMVYKGINNIARVGELVCWFILIGIIYIGLKSFSSADLGTLLPFFKDGVKPLFNSAYTYNVWFGSSTFLLMLFGQIDFKTKKNWKLAIHLLIAIFLVQFVYIVFYGIFQITAPTHSFCLSDISQFTSTHSAIDELSWLIVSLWIVAQAVQLAIYCFCFVRALKFLFDIKDDVLPTVIVMIYISLLSLIGERTVGLERFFYSSYSSGIAITAQYIVPLIVWLGAMVQTRKEKKQKNKAEIKSNKKPAKRGAK